MTLGHSYATATSDVGKAPHQLYAERAKRRQDALELRQPDRIPIDLPIGYMLAEIGGITHQELHDDPRKAQGLIEKAALEYQPDSILGLFPPDPRPHLMLGDRMTKFPGHGLDPNSQFQFVEGEFMKAEDYDEFLEDPADWAIRTYLPRAFSTLEGFGLLPPLGMALFGCYNLINIGALTIPPVAASLQAFAKAAQVVTEGTVLAVENEKRMADLGFPPGFLPSSIIEAPFDFMSDTLRGLRGIMVDVLQRPEKLLAAEAKVYKFQMKYAINWSRATGINRSFIPLHRGSDGFLSIRQFEEFYWPQLKTMIIELVDRGITPTVFYEGFWDKRLEYLADLPRGKTVGWFQFSDIFRVKEVVGDTMCIIGGMPNPMLAAGSVGEVREHTRKVCEKVGKGGGFIMSTGVGEMFGSKPALVKAWVDATREFGVY